MTSKKQTQIALPSELCRRGLYRRIEHWTQSDAWKALASEEKSWCLFALYFIGKFQEAEHFLASWFCKSWEAFPSAHVFFARSVALVRSGELARARQEWIQVFRAQRLMPLASRDSMGWYFQAQAFFCVQKSRWVAAEKWASRAVDGSFASRDLLLRSIASDMQAHAAVKMGRFAMALRFARQAQLCAKTLGNTSIQNAVRVSVACWEAERGARPLNSLRSLRSLLKEKSFHDPLSQAVLMLELSRLHILRGEFSQARQVMTRTERTLSSVGAKPLFRQRILLEQRKALLSRFLGEPEKALMTLESVFEDIPAFELSLKLEVRGQMISASREAGMSPPQHWLNEQNEWTSLVKTQRARSLLQRQKLPSLSSHSSLDDPLATLLDALRTHQRRVLALENVIDAGFLALLIPLEPRTSENIVYCIAETDSLLLSTHQGVWLLKERPTTQILSLLNVLSHKTPTKEDIFKAIWGRRYSPDRDDPGIYVLIRRLRRMLGEHASLVTTKRGHYTLKAEFKTLPLLRNSHQAAHDPTQGATNEDSRFASSFAGSLMSTSSSADVLPDVPHPRLLRLKEWIKEKQSFSAEDWEKEAHVSRASACRDLVQATERGWVLKRGEGRGVWYAPANESREKITLSKE
jgi:DNA-binding winged helix-turn-helix (wHTH) protein